MVQLVGYHSTYQKHRESILKHGLKCCKPCEHNWATLNSQPEGVYIILHGDPAQVWFSDETYRVVYCGLLCLIRYWKPATRVRWPSCSVLFRLTILRSSTMTNSIPTKSFSLEH